MGSILTLIIGKNSNLSNCIVKKQDNVHLISSRGIMDNTVCLEKFKDQQLNIIFNNFQPALSLNDVSCFENYMSNTVLITSKVLDFFTNSTINKIIYTSSSSVYGNNTFCNEKDDLKPLSLHAAMKVSNELMIQNYCEKRQIDYTITRIFNMYGGNDVFSVISKIIAKSKTDEVLTIVNNGESVRDFIHVDDVAYIYTKLLSLQNVKILNIGTGEGRTIKSILEFLKDKKVNLNINTIYKEELKTSTADTTLLRKLIDIKDFISLEEYLNKELNK